MALCDVRVFNLIAKAYLTSDLPAPYRRNELEKKRVYGRRVRMVDQASFTPLIFSCLGEMGKESLVFYKRLANSLAEQRNQEYSATANWLRSRLSFIFAMFTWVTICVCQTRYRRNDRGRAGSGRGATTTYLKNKNKQKNLSNYYQIIKYLIYYKLCNYILWKLKLIVKYMACRDCLV